MRTVLLTAALAAIFMLSGPASAEARGPYRHRGFTGLDSQFAEAELDSFTLDRKDPLFRSMKGKKIVYTLTDE